MKKAFFLSSLYIVLIFGLFLYSFTQVDLSLTLSRSSIYQAIEKNFQYIGYFQRPVSTYLYSTILLLLFIFYGIFLRLTAKNSIPRKTLWVTIIVVTVILTFAYNAFSYDLFNYIFDAKIITHYHQNPYFHRALDYPHDPMLSFMHWTQRTYPYGPTWLLLTVPLSFFTLQYFLPSFFLFKMVMSISFLVTVVLISKIMHRTNPSNELFSIALFAFNPLVLIEFLVSAHNDNVMIMLAMGAIYLLLMHKNARSVILLILSIGVKFATAALLPIFLCVFYFNRKQKKYSWHALFLIATILMCIPVIFASLRTTFQPWYMLFALPFGTLLGKKNYIIIPAVILSFFALLEYIPFLYTGNWDAPIPTILFGIEVSGIGVASIVTVGMMLKDYYYSKRTC